MTEHSAKNDLTSFLIYLSCGIFSFCRNFPRVFEDIIHRFFSLYYLPAPPPPNESTLPYQFSLSLWFVSVVTDTLAETNVCYGIKSMNEFLNPKSVLQSMMSLNGDKQCNECLLWHCWMLTLSLVHYRILFLTLVTILNVTLTLAEFFKCLSWTLVALYFSHSGNRAALYS